MAGPPEEPAGPATEGLARGSPPMRARFETMPLTHAQSLKLLWLSSTLLAQMSASRR